MWRRTGDAENVRKATQRYQKQCRLHHTKELAYFSLSNNFLTNTNELVRQKIEFHITFT